MCWNFTGYDIGFHTLASAFVKDSMSSLRALHPKKERYKKTCRNMQVTSF
jgi:hypothetical protein